MYIYARIANLEITLAGKFSNTEILSDNRLLNILEAPGLTSSLSKMGMDRLPLDILWVHNLGTSPCTLADTF